MDQSYRPALRSRPPGATPAWSCETGDPDYGPQSEWMQLQALAGCGNGYVQELMKDQGSAPDSSEPQALATVEARAEALAADGSDITAPAPEAAADQTEAALDEGAETDASPKDTAVADFRHVWRTTSAAETDAWLASLAARGAENPELASLHAELRAWVDQKRAARAARDQGQVCELPLDEAPPAVEAAEDAVCEQPEESGFWSQLGQDLADAWDAVTAWWEGDEHDPEGMEGEDGLDLDGPGEAEGEEECPVEPEPEPKAPATAQNVTYFNQFEWYGADGKELSDEEKETARTALKSVGALDNYKALGNAYNAYLQLPPAERGDTLVVNGEELTVPADVKALPQVQFVPGSASCNRAATAMVRQTGTLPAGGSGVASSHVQTLLRTDEKTWIDPATGAPKARTVTVGGKKKTVTEQEAKSTDELGPERIDVLQGNRDLATAYLDAELEAGRAVMVGMSYTTRDGNRDLTTDHWVTVVGREGDAYIFYDPGSNQQKVGKFSGDPTSGGVLETTEGRRYSVSQVMFNAASANTASTVHPDQTWAEAASDANVALSDETALECALGWTGDEECKKR